MGKAAATKKTTTEINQIEQILEVQAAKTQFVAATMNLGWRLAFTVVVPLVAGVKIDEHFHSAPSYTLTGIIVAATAGCAAVWGTIKQVNSSIAEQDAQKVKMAKKGRKLKNAR